jgi:hypothetical protein
MFLPIFANFLESTLFNLNLLILDDLILTSSICFKTDCAISSAALFL